MTYNIKCIISSVFSIFLLSTVACKAEDVCISTIVAHSIAFRGAVICNGSWLDREGSYHLLAQAQKCKKFMKKSLVERGFRDFDRSVTELGKTAACEKLDRMLRNFE